MAGKKKSGPVIEITTTDSDDARERKWRAEDALRTLTEAERVKKDKALMKDVEKARAEKMRDLECIKVETAPQTMGKRGK